MNNLVKWWKIFTSAPHRVFFFWGAIQSLLTVSWWIADLAGRYTGLYAPIAWTMSSVDAHAFLMIYGFFPFFIFGFLMTTFPRWMNGEEVERKAYLAAFLFLASGSIMFYVGLFLSLIILRIAYLLFLTGWGLGLYALLRVYLRAKHPDKRHATITSVVLGFGWLLLAGIASNNDLLIAIAKVGGIWLILLPVFFAVSHRMIPFFSANVIPDYKIVRPNWILAVVPSLALIHGFLELVGWQAWTWMVDLPMALSAIYLTCAWHLRDSLRVPILGMLHIGFAWFGLAMALYALQSLILCFTGQWLLAKAPLHAITIGYFSSVLMAMATRVTLGHSGRMLNADRLTWGIFLALQSVAILRIFSELPGLDFLSRTHFYLGSALLWLLCFWIWAIKYLAIYWQDRPN
ncbi:MAG: NnrS family protein [Methylotenera sp.]|jgi:uncharacterized protein involved in response to NO|nr:NnrS family protein [Methylotenera sp.]